MRPLDIIRAFLALIIIGVGVYQTVMDGDVHGHWLAFIGMVLGYYFRAAEEISTPADRPEAREPQSHQDQERA